ncbi:hypothetical protein [Scytonema sp. NUACC26]|uniref:hypothetical protein n=1 Tax=Scytonema sp. NUACC26 TaxID=3140176 RepID=UPI0034DC3ED3
MSNYCDISYSSNDNLIVTLTDEAKEQLDYLIEMEMSRGATYEAACAQDGIFIDLFEYHLCNGWSTVLPEDIGALTSGLLLRSPEGKIYWDESYAVRSLVDDLVEKGKCVLLYGDDEDNEMEMEHQAVDRKMEKLIIRLLDDGIVFFVNDILYFDIKKDSVSPVFNKNVDTEYVVYAPGECNTISIVFELAGVIAANFNNVLTLPQVLPNIMEGVAPDMKYEVQDFRN